MKANFLKSITTGIIGLTLLSGCSHFAKKADTNGCNANGCSPKKNEKNSCKSKNAHSSCHGKKDVNSCKSKNDLNTCKAKKDTNSCKGKKDATVTTTK